MTANLRFTHMFYETIAGPESFKWPDELSLDNANLEFRDLTGEGSKLVVGRQDIFLGSGGLFPTPREISFSCSCPDWAMMCKHVAAALYGVGARLDADPLLFFTLRGIETTRFVDVVIANRVESMLANVDRPSPRIIRDASLDELFGVL